MWPWSADFPICPCQLCLYNSPAEVKHLFVTPPCSTSLHLQCCFPPLTGHCSCILSAAYFVFLSTCWFAFMLCHVELMVDKDRKKLSPKKHQAKSNLRDLNFSFPLPMGSQQTPDHCLFHDLSYILFLSISFLLHLNFSSQISHLPSSLLLSSPVFLNLCRPLSYFFSSSLPLPVVLSDLSSLIQLSLSFIISALILSHDILCTS